MVPERQPRQRDAADTSRRTAAGRSAAPALPAPGSSLLAAAGNQALQRLVAASGDGAIAPPPVRPQERSDGRRVQRVGGVKIGFDLKPTTEDTVGAKVKEGQSLLLNTWRAVRQAGREAKVGKPTTTGVDETGSVKAKIEKEATERIDYTKKKKAGVTPLPPAKKYGFSDYYAQQLTANDRANQEAALKKTQPFTKRFLKLSGDEIEYDSLKTDYVDIATLKRGTDAFAQARTVDKGKGKTTYSKKGVTDSLGSTDPKEYVRDSRGAFTRRFAYVEKNYYQMMEFFMTNHMEGRFQAYMKAAGAPAPDLFEHRDEPSDIVVPETQTDRTLPLTLEQMAVVHQKLGSGPQQRGVSLTSTPKVNATYVNTGENFRTDEGFRLKVDLSLVPDRDDGGPIFLNHYGSGGVLDQTGGVDTRRERGGGGKYPYAYSSIHAREIYLEYLKPEWIVAIEYHDQGNKTGSGTGSTTLTTTSDLEGKGSLQELAAAKFGGTAYQDGFAYGLSHDTVDPLRATDRDFSRGFDGARLFHSGWTEGHGDHTKDGANDATKALSEGISIEQYIYDQTIKKTAHEDKFDLFRTGYLYGRRGKPMITSPSDLKTLSA